MMYSGEEPPEATTVTASDHCCIYALLWWLKIVIFLLYFIKVEIDMINKTDGFGSLTGWILIRIKTNTWLRIRTQIFYGHLSFFFSIYIFVKMLKNKVYSYFI